MGTLGGPQDGVVFTQNITAAGDGQVNVLQHGDQYNYIYRGTPPYRVEPFPPARSAVLPAELARVPSRLLAARHEVVPFFPRPEVTLLESWRDDESPGLSVRLVHAEGGAGKTRLAAEFAARSARVGWAVALARHRSEVASAGAGDQTLAVRAPGLVMVVDYAERWPLEDLITLVRQHRAAARDRLRILLLSRPAGTWWQGLAHQFAKLDILDVDAVGLAALPDTPGVRADIYVQARDRFAEVLALSEPAGFGVPEHLDDPVFALTLTVHMRALVDVDAASRGQAPPSGSGQASLSSYLLDREHDYWRSSHDRGYGPLTTAEKTMGRAVYLATLTRSQVPGEAARALLRTNVTDSDIAACEQIVRDHTRCYPPQDQALVFEPLVPDRLGEDYLALTLPGREEEYGYYATDPWSKNAPTLLLAPTTSDDSPPAFTRQVISTLIEAAHRWPPVVSDHLEPLLRRHPALAVSAGSAALTRLTDLPDLDPSVLEAVAAELPDRADVDVDVGAAALIQRITDRRLAITTDLRERSALYFELGFRYGNAGLHQLSLEPTARAVGISRELAQGDYFGTQGLAMALNNYGLQLAAAGRTADALDAAKESVTIRLPFMGAYGTNELSSLAGAITNLGNRLSEAGDRKEALASCESAVGILRHLVDNGAVDCQVQLAEALTNLGARLSEASRHEDSLATAIEATAVHRRLAAAEPGAHLPGLASALTNLGIEHSKLGHHQASVAPSAEAVMIRRRLAEANPARYRAELAHALSNLSNRFTELGNHREAEPPAREAAEILRRLAEADPAAHLLDLNGILRNLRILLAKADHNQEAVAVMREEVAVTRRLTQQDPAVHRPLLAVLLGKLAFQIAELGRDEEALAPIEESIEITRELAKIDPRLLPMLLGLANNHRVLLVRLRRYRAILEASREIVATIRLLAEDDPAGYLPTLAEELSKLAFVLKDLGHHREAGIAIEEASAIRT